MERYLEGQELTITVLPGDAGPTGREGVRTPIILPPVRRFNHDDGIAPYNGTVAVTTNSAALAEDEYSQTAVRALMHACAAACTLLGATAPVRLNCRADAEGSYQIFDVNMKPNMTGAGRPGLDDQDNLCAIAARAVGWSYADFLIRMLNSAWISDTKRAE